jgi:hypothetical protein
MQAQRNGTSRRGKPWRLLRMLHHLLRGFVGIGFFAPDQFVARSEE